MKSPVTTTLKMAGRDMPYFWGEAHCLPSDIVIHNDVSPNFQSPDTKTFYAAVTYTFDISGVVCRINIDLAGEMLDPTEDPDEPIPYEVTSEGREIAKMWEKNGKDWPGTMEELAW